MLDTYHKILSLMETRERKTFVLLIGIMIFAAFAEIVGLASFMVLLGILADPNAVSNNGPLKSAYDWFQFTDIFSFQLAAALGVAVITMIGLIVKAGTLYAVIRFSTLCSHSLSSRMLHAYLRQPYDWSLDKNTADMGRQILSECEQLITRVVRPALSILASTILSLSIVGFLIAVDPFIALMSFALLGGGYGSIYLFTRKKLQRIGAAMIKANKERFRITQEATAGLKDVKLAGLEDIYASEFRAPSLRRAQYVVRAQMYLDIPRFGLEGLTFAVLLTMVLSLLLRNDGDLLAAIPTLGIFAFSVMRILPALQQVYHGFASIRTGQAILEQVYDAFEETRTTIIHPPEIDRTTRLSLAEQLSFESVSYTYPSAQKTALKDLSVDIKAGTSVGIVGGTGAGKTTFVDLLLGLLAADEGRISVDGQPITGPNLRAWQNAIGYVPQQIFLTDDTLKANIAFGVLKEGVDFDAVKKSAQTAALDTFIMDELPDGYDTSIGERGVRLSGGQRQRIGIARALYHDPSILILDEATSALDNITERAVMEAVQKLHGQKTIIMIAHRLSTVENCDTIILMENGQIAAQGTYAELAAQNKTFQEMLGKSDVKAS